jgi:hypothetical protein
MSDVCHPNYIMVKHSNEPALQKYWRILNRIRVTNGKNVTRQTKGVWIKKMRTKIEEDKVCRDLQLYEYILKTTGGLRDWEKMELSGDNVYRQVIALYNRGVKNHSWDSLEDRISLFNRVWVMGNPTVKTLNVYNKRADIYMKNMRVNNYMIHLIIYLHITSS